MQHLADRFIGRDPARGNQRRRLAVAVAERLDAGAQPVGDDINDALLEGSAEVAYVLVGERRYSFRLQPQRGLEPRERKIGVRAPDHGPRQREAPGVAAERLPFHLRTAGITETKKLCRLVEGLADGVVDRGAEPLIIA